MVDNITLIKFFRIIAYDIIIRHVCSSGLRPCIIIIAKIAIGNIYSRDDSMAL